MTVREDLHAWQAYLWNLQYIGIGTKLREHFSASNLNDEFSLNVNFR